MIGLVSAQTLANIWPFSKNKDVKSIERMAGCYEVTYVSKETRSFSPTYNIRSKDNKEVGLEWIGIDRSNAHEVHLQHILVMNDMVQKHWRQEWTKNPKRQVAYLGNQTWENTTVAMPANHKRPLWSQSVLQVDDAPRYACAAEWIHAKNYSSWNCIDTYSPLPRREFSQRKDYNLLLRSNHHQVSKKQWFHFQENEKFNVVDNVYTWIAHETGTNTYKKVASSKCSAAKDWWKNHKHNWNIIQDMWKHIFDHHTKITFHEKINGKTLWMELFAIEEKFFNLGPSQANDKMLAQAAHDKIHEFMKEHN
jgi:hypothetical protein